MLNVLPGSVDDPQPLPAVPKTLKIFNINLLIVVFIIVVVVSFVGMYKLLVMKFHLVSLNIAFYEVLLGVACLLPHHLQLTIAIDLCSF